MKKKIVVLLFLALICFVFAYISYLNSDKEGQEATIVSPIPDFLNVFKNKQVSGISLWFFNLGAEKNDRNSKLQISAQSALIFDLETQKVLYEKSPKERLPMASLTKIMTAIIALENPKKDNKYIVSSNDLVGENSMGLGKGEILTLEELLFGMMLPSGNDAAETIATNYKDGRVAFIEAMNEKAIALGLKDTNFTNPSGLEGDGAQYTTAYDLVVISKYALENFAMFKKVVSVFDLNIEQTSTHKAYYLENETNLLTSYPGVKGIKTGYTPEAGLCLVTYLDYKGHKLIGVILGSGDRRGEMIELLDYSLQSLGVNPPPHG